MLVVNEHHKTLLIIEAKTFASPRNPRETKGEIDKLVAGRSSAVARHSERVSFVRDQWPVIHRQIRLPGQASDWQIRDMIVTSGPSIAADLLRPLSNEIDTTIIPLDELSRTLKTEQSSRIKTLSGRSPQQV